VPKAEPRGQDPRPGTGRPSDAKKDADERKRDEEERRRLEEERKQKG
jgi:hypothetical protein